MIRAAAVALLLSLQPAVADVAAEARRAIDLLSDAGTALAQADSARDKVGALTETVRAYEAGLAALRAGIRNAAFRERTLRNDLWADQARLQALLGGLMTMEHTPPAARLLHPGGPADSVRAGLILAEIGPAIEARTAALNRRLDEIDLLRTLQENARITLERGLDGVEAARISLSQAISDRTRPDLSATDAATMQALVESADTLDGFATSISAFELTAAEHSHDFNAARGQLNLPAPGRVLTGFREPDRRGTVRPGLTLAVPPRTLVTAPHSGTLRYAGPLLALGEVVILEPAPGTMIVLAGLGQSYGRPGDILDAGDALGLMSGEMPDAEQILIESAGGTGQDHSETLYIEIRQGQTPVDPALWFRLTQETGTQE